MSIKEKKIILFVVWLILAVLLLDKSFALLSAKSTFCNIGGIGIIVAYALASVRTQMFTTFAEKI